MFASRLHPLVNNLCVVFAKTEIKSDFKCFFYSYIKKLSITI